MLMKVGELLSQKKCILLNLLLYQQKNVSIHFYRYNVLDEDEIQGEEDGVSGMDGNVQVSLMNDLKINSMPMKKQNVEYSYRFSLDYTI